MSKGAPWAAYVEFADTPALVDLRLAPDLEIAEIAHLVWLRGPAWDAALGLELRKIPGLRLFQVVADGGLLPHGARVPTGRLPELRWQPLRAAAPVRLPAPLPGGNAPAPVALGLVRSGGEQTAGGLLTEAAAWRNWVVGAAEIRLRPLRFAAAHNGRVWIEGTPVPPLAGRRYYVRDGLAVPCGFAWSPPVDPLVLARRFELAKGDVALASTEGGWEVIKDEQFVPATRSGARLTAEAFERDE